jgi:hypothetical protein
LADGRGVLRDRRRSRQRAAQTDDCCGEQCRQNCTHGYCGNAGFHHAIPGTTRTIGIHLERSMAAMAIIHLLFSTNQQSMTRQNAAERRQHVIQGL